MVLKVPSGLQPLPLTGGAGLLSPSLLIRPPLVSVQSRSLVIVVPSSSLVVVARVLLHVASAILCSEISF